MKPSRNSALGAVLALVLLGLVAARSVDVDATAMGRSALREASARTGIRLEGSQFHFNLLQGLRIEGVEAGASFPERALRARDPGSAVRNIAFYRFCVAWSPSNAWS